MPLRSVFCCVFIGFTNLLIFLESAAYASCQENIICHSWPRWWENIWLCLQSAWLTSTGYKFYALKSGNVRGTKEIICFINWIFTGNAEAKWSCFETCLVHCVVLLMGSDVLITLTKCVCWGTYFRINFDVKLLHSENWYAPAGEGCM